MSDERQRSPSRALLIGPGTVCTPDEVLAEAGVLVEGERISAVGPFATLRHANAEAMSLDAGGGLILPGLIMAHTHLYSALARGMALRGEAPRNFIEILSNLWWRLDRALDYESIELAALVQSVACVRCGVTTIIDHHSSPNAILGSLDVIARAAALVGLRAALCYEISDRDGPKAAQEAIAENVRFAKRLQSEGNGRLAACMGVHAMFTVAEDTIEDAVRLAGELNLGLHLHLAEDRADVLFNLERYGLGPAERLLRHGGLNEKTIAAHGVHLSERERRLIAETGARIIHNPRSNMNNAVGCAPIGELLAANVTVGLGTDGMGPDMLGEAQTAFLLMRHEAHDPRPGAAEVERMLWRNNAAIASSIFDRPLGKIAPDCCADLIVLDYFPPTLLDSSNRAGHLLFGLRTDQVRHVIVNGRIVLQDRRLSGLDEADLAARTREAAAKLWERIQ